MRIITYTFLILIILLGITFAALNSQDVTIHYYLGTRTMPLSFLIAVSFALGCLLAMCVSVWMLLKMKIKIFRLRQQLKG